MIARPALDGLDALERVARDDHLVHLVGPVANRTKAVDAIPELERQVGGYSLLLGALAGVLFFDLSLFGWLVMLALAVVVVRVPLIL